MDIFTDNPSYFTQYVVSLPNQSALVRYAAVALAAKQLGQMKDPARKTPRTHHQRLIVEAFTDLTALGEPDTELSMVWCQLLRESAPAALQRDLPGGMLQLPSIAARHLPVRHPDHRQ